MTTLITRLIGNQILQKVYISGSVFTYIVAIPYNITSVTNTLPDFNTIPIYYEPFYVFKIVGYTFGASLVCAFGFPITIYNLCTVYLPI